MKKPTIKQMIEREQRANAATLKKIKKDTGALIGLYMRQHRALVAIAKAIGPVIYDLRSGEVERKIDIEDIKQLNLLISEPYDGQYDG